MEEEHERSSDRDAETIYFSSLHELYGGLRLARRYITKQRLEYLFQSVGGIIVLDENAEEVLPTPEGLYPNLKASVKYTVSDEEQLADLDRPESERPNLGERQAKYIQRLHAMVEARRRIIQELYTPLHPKIYLFTEDILEPAFLSAIVRETDEDLQGIVVEHTRGLYSMPMFTKEFCRMFVEEIENFENAGLPISRPNSMNNYGVILDEIGFTPFLADLRDKCVLPFAKLFFARAGGTSLDSHHGFVVQYKIGEDVDLDFHYDDSEVTLNVCLGKKFEGGELYFKGLLHDPSTHNEDFEYQHKVGTAVIHAGTHRHGAKPLTGGERYNLILWCRSSSLRLSRQQIHQHVASKSHHYHHHHAHSNHNGHSHDHRHHDENILSKSANNSRPKSPRSPRQVSPRGDLSPRGIHIPPLDLSSRGGQLSPRQVSPRGELSPRGQLSPHRTPSPRISNCPCPHCSHLREHHQEEHKGKDNHNKED